MKNKIIISMMAMILLIGLVGAIDYDKSMKELNYKNNVVSFDYGDIYCKGRICKVEVNTTLTDRKVKSQLITDKYIFTSGIRINKTNQQIADELKKKQYEFQQTFAINNNSKETKPKQTWIFQQTFSNIFDAIMRVFK